VQKARRSRVVWIALALPLSWLFWFALVGTTAVHELLAGIVATLLTAIGLVVVESNYPSKFAPSVADLLALRRLPWYLIRDTFQVLAIAAAGICGVHRGESIFRIVPFASGDPDDPADAGRRVLAVWYSSATPSSVVLGVNSGKEKVLLLHQLSSSPLTAMLKQLGARE
jgi:hypothetical protein